MSLILPKIDLTEIRPLSKKGEPTWEMVYFFPAQGDWTESDYFALDTNRLVELSEGFLEALPMPSLYHQDIVVYLHGRLQAFLDTWGKGGRAYLAPVPIRLWPGKIREPDVFLVPQEALVDRKKTPEKIDFAMEVVSEGEANRERDYEAKWKDYAAAKVPEYWIVDPQERRIRVFFLAGDTYTLHGNFGPGETATSSLLPGFEVSVAECFAAGQG